MESEIYKAYMADPVSDMEKDSEVVVRSFQECG